MNMEKKVFVYGSDNMGWSIDSDRNHAIRFLNDIGMNICKTPLFCSAIHCVWWTKLRRALIAPFRNKKIIAVATNEINERTEEFNKINSFVTLWIAPSRKQELWFLEQNIPCFYLPFYVDEKVFYPRDIPKAMLCEMLCIDYALLEDRFIIGSFQRDSLGENLQKPKWQKNPDLLIDIVSELPIDRDKFVLLLAGPRRHYIIEQCRKRNLPFVFVGKYPHNDEDDIHYNTLPTEKTALLYNLIDCYIVTSRSEGGPKGIVEASYTKKPVISTRTGAAPDYLCDNEIFDSKEECIKTLCKLYNSKRFAVGIAGKSFEKSLSIGCYKKTKERYCKLYVSLGIINEG
ncbi:MAG: glycosyltransferase [Chitinivibrionales bacterium]|nr:glycosyltransferase [Chitinivibrionales bacterium]